MIYSAFKHAVQVMWTCKTDICIENLVRLRACHSFKKTVFCSQKKKHKKRENKCNTFGSQSFLFSKKTKKSIENIKIK